MLRILPAAILATFALTPAAALGAQISFVPSSGAKSSCTMTLKRTIKHNGHNQSYSEKWSRDMAVAGGGRQATLNITFIPEFQKRSVFKFAENLSTAPLKPIDPRDVDLTDSERVVFASAFPESGVFGRRVSSGSSVRPLPEFRSEFTREQLDSGQVKEKLRRNLSLRGVESFGGAQVYAFQGSVNHNVTHSDGSTHSNKANTVMRFDTRTRMLRQATFVHKMEMFDPRDNDRVIHENKVEWRCRLR